MQVCSRCVLPETFPGISFENGVCNFCREFDADREAALEPYRIEKSELSAFFDKARQAGAPYDALVALSGGVDSSAMAITLAEEYGLRLLGFHNDHGYEDPGATENVRNLCRTLGIDLVILQHDYAFMKRLWNYLFKSQVKGLPPCFVCGNILYANALRTAERFGVRMLINGYSKGQASLVQQQGNRMRLLEFLSTVKDAEFVREFSARMDIAVKKQRFFQGRADLADPPEAGKIMVLPFYALSSGFRTDKAALQKKCIERFGWKPIENSYPARTTNCHVVWLSARTELERSGYCTYHEEYSKLVRIGEMTREEALRDLEFNPPAGLLERLGDEIIKEHA